MDYTGYTIKIPKSVLPSWSIKALDTLSDRFGVSSNQGTLRAGIGDGLTPSLFVELDSVKALSHEGDIRIGMVPHRTNYHPITDTNFWGKGARSTFDSNHTEISNGQGFVMDFSGETSWRTPLEHMSSTHLNTSFQTGLSVGFNGQVELYNGADIEYKTPFNGGNGEYISHTGADVNLNTVTGAEGSLYTAHALTVRNGGNKYGLKSETQATIGGDRSGISFSQQLTAQVKRGDNSAYLSGAIGTHNQQAFTQLEGGLCHDFNNETRICAVGGYDTAFDVDGFKADLQSQGATFGDGHVYGGFKIDQSF